VTLFQSHNGAIAAGGGEGWRCWSGTKFQSHNGAIAAWELVQLKGFPEDWGTTFPSDLEVQRNLFDIPLDAPPLSVPSIAQ